MGAAQGWIVDVLLPVIVLIALVWLVFLRESKRTDRRVKGGTLEPYADEERRRGAGTDAF